MTDGQWLEKLTAQWLVSSLNQARRTAGLKPSEMRILVLLEQDLTLATILARHFDEFCNPRTCSLGRIAVASGATAGQLIERFGAGFDIEVEQAEFATRLGKDWGDRNRSWATKCLLLDELPAGVYIEILKDEFVAPSGEVVDRRRL